jgi:hypothetical protein
MPALSSLSGEWAFRARTGLREIGGSLRFGSEGGGLVGAYVAPNGRATPLTNLTWNGELISFGITGSLGTWQLSGVVTGDRMSGTFETISGVVPWTAERGIARPSPTPAASAAFGRGVRSANRRPRERFAQDNAGNGPLCSRDERWEPLG